MTRDLRPDDEELICPVCLQRIKEQEDVAGRGHDMMHATCAQELHNGEGHGRPPVRS